MLDRGNQQHNSRCAATDDLAPCRPPKRKDFQAPHSFSMTTNGTIAEDSQLQFCRDMGIKYLISIDGGKESHDSARRTAGGEGSFDRIIGNLPRFKKYQPWIGARYTVTPVGAASFANGVEFLYRRGVNQFITGVAHGVPWVCSDLDDYEKSAERLLEWYVARKREGSPVRISLFEDREGLGPGWGCGAGRGRISVSALGDLYGCSKLATVHGLRKPGLFRLGDIERGIVDWRGRAILTDATDARRPECRECDLRSECAGGCPAVNYEARGNPFLPDVAMCAVTRIGLRLQSHARALLGVAAPASGHATPDAAVSPP